MNVLSAYREGQLRIYLHGELAKALIEKDAGHLEVCEKTEQKLMDAYKAAVSTTDEVPLMTNSQKIYVGLTYDRNSMFENTPDMTTVRGYYA